MRKVLMLNRVSIDGFFAGPNGEIDWFIPDPKVDKAVHDDQADTLLLGRVTYQMFESYWPPVAKDPQAPAGARKMSKELNQMTKVVFSKTLNEVTWENSKLVKGDVVQEVQALKEGKGRHHIMVFGSGTIVQQLANARLIDEYLFIVTPVVLGRGKPMFKDVGKNNLKLLEISDFASGNVLLHYKFAGT